MNPGLFDGCFGHQLSATLGEDNTHSGPGRFTWLRDQYGTYSTFYTDMHLEYAIGAPGLRVAWLLEPPSLSDSHYQKAIQLENEFDYILTFRTDLLERGDKWLYYPLGGSWILPSSWGLVHKTRMTSIIASEKVGATGHKLRHEVVNRFRGRMDVLGRGYKPIGRKTAGLYDYMYTICIESCKVDAYFSEKLIDCFTLGVIPIYWGCPSIGDFFDTDGMIIWDGDLDTLDGILSHLTTRKEYERRKPALENNLCLAEEYSCAEDWIFHHYPWLFEETK